MSNINNKNAISKPRYGTRKLSVGLVSGLLGFSFLLSGSNSTTALAGGVVDTNDTSGTTVLYANGENPLKVGKEEMSVADLIKVSVEFPTANGENAYSTSNKEVTITYIFNQGQRMNWTGRPFYWFSLPKGVKEPKEIVLTNKRGEQTFTSWSDWRQNNRWVASRYQDLSQILDNSEGNPDKWEGYNDTTGETKRDYLGSLNYQFNRMLDDQEGGWYDNNGNTNLFANNIRKSAKSIYVDWEPKGNRTVKIQIKTEVIDPLNTKDLKVGAGVFSVMGNIRRANLQVVNTPHVITDAELYELTLIDKKEVEDTAHISHIIKEQIRRELWDKTENQALHSKIKNDIDGLKVDDDGTTTVVYNDGTKDIIPGSLLLKKKVVNNTQASNISIVSNNNLTYKISPIPVNNINSITEEEARTAFEKFLSVNVPNVDTDLKWHKRGTRNESVDILKVAQGVSPNLVGKSITINNTDKTLFVYSLGQEMRLIATIPIQDLYYAKATSPNFETIKNDAKAEIDKLTNLTQAEKDNFKNQIGNAENNADAIQRILDEAIKKNEENKKELEKAKTAAKEEIDKLKYLSDEEKKAKKAEIDGATTKDEVSAKLEAAKTQNLEKAKDTIKSTIDKLAGLTDDKKTEEKDKVGVATSVEQAENILKEAQKEDAEKKAQESKAEADRLKQEYKDKIDAIDGLSNEKKTEYKNNIDNATNKGQMDSILQFAKTEATRTQAQAKIDELTHLNNKQKEEYKDRIDNLLSQEDIDNEVSEARQLDSKMEVLQSLVSTAGGSEVQNRKTTAAEDKKTAFEKALTDAKNVSIIESGRYSDIDEVEKLTKALEKAINDLKPDATPIKAPVSKTALEKEIAAENSVKAKDIYTNATPNKKQEYENKLAEAKRVKDKTDATQDEVDKALQDLQQARQNLDGTFKLEKIDDTPVTIDVVTNDGTVVTKDGDRNNIKAKVTGIPDDAIVSFSPIKLSGSDKIVTVTVVKDGITKSIDIKVVGDEHDPTITDIDNKTLTKGEDFAPIVISANDEGSGLKTTGGITVSDLPSWLSFDETTKTIKLNSPDTTNPNKVPNSATVETKTITVTATDNAGRTSTKTFTITLQEQKDKYDVQAKNGENVKTQNAMAGSPEAYIEKKVNTPDLPTGTIYKWKGTTTSAETDDITLDTAGDSIQKTAVVIYPDGSKDEVVVTFKVTATAPSTPTVEAKKNGDVVITPPVNADKIKVTYTPEGATESITETIAKAENGDWTLPSGDKFKLEDGKIVLKDEATKDNTEVKVTASSGNSVPTSEVSVTTPEAKPSNPTNPVYIKGNDTVGSTISEENKNHIKEQIPVENLNGGTPSIGADATVIAGADNSKEVKVDVTYDDGSKDTINVKVIGDSTAPSLTLPVVPSMTKGDDFTNLVINANDEGSGLRENNPIEVLGLPSWLVFDNATNTIKLADSANGKIPKDADTTTSITVKAYDKAGNVAENTLTITLKEARPVAPTVTIKENGDVVVTPPSDATKVIIKYTPDKENTPKEVEIGKKTDGTWNLPEGLKQDENGNIILPSDKVKKDTEISATATNENGTSDNSNVVTKPSEDKVVPTKPVVITGSDEVGSELSNEDKDKIKDSINKDKLNGGTVSIPDGTKVTTDKDGNPVVEVIITYPDETSKVVEVPVSQKDTIKYGVVVPEDKVKVNDKGNLTNEEKDKVKEAIKNANPNLPEGTDIEIANDGTATIKDANGNIITTIPGNKLIADSNAASITPSIPEKTQVLDATKLNEAEKEVIKRAVEEVNRDKFPEGTRVEVKGDGTVVITYPDGSVDTISGEKLVDNLKPARETIADKTSPIVPSKTKVKNPTNLSEDEKNEVMNKVLDENNFNTGTVVEIKGDGTAIITYPDGSQDSIKGSDLVEKDIAKSDAKKNSPVKPDTKVEVDNINKLTEEEKQTVKDAVKDKNPSAAEVEVSNDGTATIKYPDGSVNTIKGSDLVDQKQGTTTPSSDASTHTPSVPDTKITVEDSTKLTDDEKEKVKDVVKEKNPDAKDVEVSNDGTATIIYNDESVNTINKDKLVEEKQDIPTKAETIQIDKPDTKIEVVNDTKLTDKEKEEVIKAVKDKNPGKLDNANIEVSNDGTVTINFDDGSTKTIDREDVIAKKPTTLGDQDNLSVADKTDIVAPEHTKVNEVGKLTDAEKDAIKKAVEDANPGKLDNTNIDVIGDGTVIITYPDGSVDSIPGIKTVVVSKNADEPAIYEIPDFPLDKLKEESLKIVEDKVNTEIEEIENSNILNDLEKKLAKDELAKRANELIGSINNSTNNEELTTAVEKGLDKIEKTDIDSKIVDTVNVRGGGSSSSRGLGGGTVLRVVNSNGNNNSTNISPLEESRKKISSQLEKAVKEKKNAIESSAELANVNKDILKIDLEARYLRFIKELDAATSESALNEILNRALADINGTSIGSANNTITVSLDETLSNNSNTILGNHTSLHKSGVPKTADNNDMAMPSMLLGAGLAAMFGLSKLNKREDEE